MVQCNADDTGAVPLQGALWRDASHLSSVLNSLDLETAEALTTAPATNCDLPYPFTPVYACTSVTFSVEYMCICACSCSNWHCGQCYIESTSISLVGAAHQMAMGESSTCHGLVKNVRAPA